MSDSGRVINTARILANDHSTSLVISLPIKLEPNRTVH